MTVERDIPLFDCNCAFGSTGAPQPGAYTTAVDLLRQMDHCGIDEALVFHAQAWVYQPAWGNARLMAEIAGQPRLRPCWVVLPEHTGELPPGTELVQQMQAQGVRAARLYPQRIGPLREFVYGSLFAALAVRRIPLILDYELGHWASQLGGIDWDGLDWALASFPALPIVLARVGMALDRLLIPLLQRRPNLHLEISYYVGHGGLARMVSAAGPERLLFGTGMPVYAPGPAITLLTYCGLDAQTKRMIGAGNLQRLLQGALEGGR